MWRRVYLVWTDVFEERIASIFRVEKSASDQPAHARGFFYPEDGGDAFLQNVGSHQIFTALHPQKMVVFIVSRENPKPYINLLFILRKARRTEGSECNRV
jgi:hypothetical protein